MTTPSTGTLAVPSATLLVDPAAIPAPDPINRNRLASEIDAFVRARMIDRERPDAAAATHWPAIMPTDEEREREAFANEGLESASLERARRLIHENRVRVLNASQTAEVPFVAAWPLVLHGEDLRLVQAYFRAERAAEAAYAAITPEDRRADILLRRVRELAIALAEDLFLNPTDEADDDLADAAFAARMRELSTAPSSPAAPDAPRIELPPSPFVDVAALLAGNHEAPSPSIGRRSDGAHLYYASATNVLVGDPESGKSLIAAAVAAETLADGGCVLWLDLDHNGAPSILARLRAFGVPDAVLADPMRFRLAVVEDRHQLDTIVAMSIREGGAPELAVVDSVGELVGLYGGDQNSDAEYTSINRATLARLASAGACVLAIDHLAKGSDSRAYGAAGSVAKKRAVDGVMLRVELVRPFVPGHGGRARLLVVKDRHGGVREVSGAGKAPLAASFEITPGAPLRWRFWAPEEQSKGGPETPERDAPALSARVLADLATIAAVDPRPTSKSQVQKATGWGSQRALDALRALRDSF